MKHIIKILILCIFSISTISQKEANKNLDSDGDGVLDGLDCAPLNTSISQGAPCNDFDPCTRNDNYDESCNCVGINIPSCSTIEVTNRDCEYGMPCDDNDPCTRNDILRSNCQCLGLQIYDCEECAQYSPCDDSNPCTSNDRFNNNCDCVGSVIPDCDEYISNSPCDDNDPCTIEDKINSSSRCLGKEQVQFEVSATKNDNCQGRNIKLNAFNKKCSWSFENNQIAYNEESIEINTPGNYVATFTNKGCQYERSIYLSFEQLSNYIAITKSAATICNNRETLNLSIDKDLYISQSWLLNGNLISTLSEIDINSQGTYSVSAQDNFGCLKETKITIESSISNAKIFPKNPVICDKELITLEIVDITDINSIVWKYEGIPLEDNDINIHSIEVSLPGMYSVDIESSKGCIATDEVIVANEEDLDIDRILIDAGFLKEPVTIHDFEHIDRGEKESENRSILSTNLNAQQANSYDIVRHIVNPGSDPINLNKLIQAQMDLYGHYDHNVQGRLLDRFCPNEPTFQTVDEFLAFSEKESNFAYYICSGEDGDLTHIYYRSPNTPKSKY